MDAKTDLAPSNRLDQAIQRLKDSGLRFTRFRRKLIELLLDESPRALSVEEIHTHPVTSKADLVTVYRNVDALVQIELLKRLSDENGKSIYKLNELREPTLSITCRDCHSVHESPLVVHAQLENLARSIGYTSLSSKCEVVGYCEDCARKRKS